MPSRMYTIETRIPGNTELYDYLNTYVTEYSALEREMWQDMTSADFHIRYPKISQYVTHICSKYNLLKRTVNSIRYEVQGRMKSLMELKKTELNQTVIKISVKEDRISSTKAELDVLKKKAVNNSLTDKEHERYHDLKTSLYWQKNRLNKLRQRKKNLEYQVNNRIYSMCYGSKAMFRKQYLLTENGYKTHEKWHNDFVKARDKNIFYLGSSDESYGNQMCRLRYEETAGTFMLEVRKEYKYCTDGRYVCLKGLDFRYMKEELVEILKTYGTGGKGSFPLSYRFHREGNRWYVQVIFEQSFKQFRTVPFYGTVGLDYNDGFIEMSETDESGNLVSQGHYGLKYHGTGKRAESEIRETVSKITGYAESKGKDIVIEDLDFRKTKAKQTASNSKKGKRYNRMIHLFDYRRYKEALRNAGFSRRVNIIMVNPGNTSKIGKQKYSESRKMNVHQAASYVIARRGQGYKDRLTA